MSETVRRGRGRPPAAKSADTRGRILRTAREVFADVGYDAATFQAIAVRAELTRPAINHYFPSKRVLYREVVEQINATIIESGVREARRHRGFGDRMHAFLSSVQANDHDSSVAAFLVTSVVESQRHPELAEDGNDVLDTTREFVEWALREADAAGELRSGADIVVLTETVLAMLVGVGFYAGFHSRTGDGGLLGDLTGEFLRLLGGSGFLRSD